MELLIFSLLIWCLLLTLGKAGNQKMLSRLIRLDVKIKGLEKQIKELELQTASVGFQPKSNEKDSSEVGLNFDDLHRESSQKSSVVQKPGKVSTEKSIVENTDKNLDTTPDYKQNTGDSWADEQASMQSGQKSSNANGSKSSGSAQGANQTQLPFKQYIAPPAQKVEPHPAIVAVKEFFTTGNVLAKVGAIILLFGIGFVLNYVSASGLLSIEVRLLGAAGLAFGMIIAGWKWRIDRPSYAWIIQGVGIGGFYLVVFAASKLYNLVPTSMAFFILFGIAVFSNVLAVLQNSISVATIGVIGGFLAPVLMSTGSGSHIGLFSYYMLLNLGIFGVAWFKPWRLLNVIGFTFTFIIGLSWGVLKYKPEHFATTEPFLIAFFLLFSIIPILYARKHPGKKATRLDGSLIFGTPAIAFGLQLALVQDYELWSGISAIVVGLYYAVMAKVIKKMEIADATIFLYTFLSMAVLFGTLAVPLTLDGHWTAVFWALESAGIYWVSCAQEKPYRRYFSILMIFAAGVSFLLGRDRLYGATPLLNVNFIGALLTGIAALAISYAGSIRLKAKSAAESTLLMLVLAWGIGWVFISSGNEGMQFFTWLRNAVSDTFFSFLRDSDKAMYGLGFVAIVSVAVEKVGRRFSWELLRLNSHLLLVAIFLGLLLTLGDRTDILSGLSWVLWIAVSSVYVWILNYKSDQFKSKELTDFCHAAFLGIQTILITRVINNEVSSIVSLGSSWGTAVVGLIPALALISVQKLVARDFWMFKKRIGAYLGYYSGFGVIFLLWYFIVATFMAGHVHPIPYLPVLNPLDITQGLAISSVMGALVYFQAIGRGIKTKKGSYILLGSFVFVLLNAMLLRMINHYGDVAYNSKSMFRSDTAQAAISILWTLIGLGLILKSGKIKHRKLWIFGASFMGVVAVKLFLVDLSHAGSLSRIISFLAVGILFLVVGYLVPIPPDASELSESSDKSDKSNTGEKNMADPI